MPSASPFEGGLICGINKTTDTSTHHGWDCDDYFPMCDDILPTYTASVVQQHNPSMTPHLGHVIAHQQQQQPHQQHQMVAHDDGHMLHHQLQQQQQQQTANSNDFTVYLLPLGHNENNNNNGHQMNNNNTSTAAHKTASVFSSVNSSPNGSWEDKMPAEWTESDTIDWLFNVAGKLGIPCEYFASSNPIRGSHLLEMNKEDFLIEYPHHGHKFYEAFRVLMHQIQSSQHQISSPVSSHHPSIESNDSICLQQNTPAVHHNQNGGVGDCWSSLVSPTGSSPMEPNYNLLHPSGSVAAMVQQAENNPMGQYCPTTVAAAAATTANGDRHHHLPYPSMESTYTYMHPHSHPHHQQHHHHHQHHTGNKTSLAGYDDALHQQQHAAYHHQQQQQQQQLHQDNYDSYSLDMIGDHYENYSNGTEPSDPEEIMASSDHVTTSVTVNGATLKRVGRPTGTKPNNRRRKQDRGYGKLWEFIRDLLHDPKYCPSMVRWEDVNDGVFRIVQSEKLANLWGTIKNNPRMTYEKLSRAMRYYYKSKVFLPVLGRRLVYKFGPHAVLWKPDNPNFEQPCLIDGQ